MVQLDRVNLRLLELLQKNARTPIADLARALNRGESTVRDRIASLERAGVIQGYRAEVDPAQLGYGIRATLRADSDPRTYGTLSRQLEAIPNVVAAAIVTGHKPLRIYLVARDLAELDLIVARRIAPLGVTGIETSVVLQLLVAQRSLQAVLPGGDGMGPSQPPREAVPHSAMPIV